MDDYGRSFIDDTYKNYLNEIVKKMGELEQEKEKADKEAAKAKEKAEKEKAQKRKKTATAIGKVASSAANTIGREAGRSLYRGVLGILKKLF